MGLQFGHSQAYVLIVLASVLARASAQYGDEDSGSYAHGSGEGGMPLVPWAGEGGTKEVFVGSRGTPGTDCACPSEVEYVCGSDGNTYDNTCMAQCAGVVPVFQGVCFNGCMCFSVFQPLCIVPVQITFLNGCLGECMINYHDPDIADFIANGECTGECVDCPRTKSTVCDVSPEGAGNEFVNSCFAECQGASQWQPGGCDQVFGVDVDCSHCSDQETFDGIDNTVPVCGVNNVTYDNACIAMCTEGVLSAFSGSCEENCDTCAEQGVAEVCGKDGITYSNACEARCALVGVNEAVAGGCESAVPGCGCSADDLLPVCAASSNTYMNACFAECAADVVESEGPCEYNSDYVDGPFDGYGNPIAVVDGVVVNI